MDLGATITTIAYTILHQSTLNNENNKPQFQSKIFNSENPKSLRLVIDLYFLTLKYFGTLFTLKFFDTLAVGRGMPKVGLGSSTKVKNIFEKAGLITQFVCYRRMNVSRIKHTSTFHYVGKFNEKSRLIIIYGNTCMCYFYWQDLAVNSNFIDET